MKTITLPVDSESCRIFEGLSPDCKQKFSNDVNLMLHSIAQNARAIKLKQLVQEINNEKDVSYLNTDMLLELLPID